MEANIEALGRRLLAAAQEREPIALSPQWWQEQLLAWATQDPAFRVKLLRFVDVLPSLRSASAVADHIRQYFRGDAPFWVQAGAQLSGPTVFRPVVSKLVRESVMAMAHRFIAGETPEQAIPRLRDLREEGVAYTVDLLGEATLSEAEADVYFDRYSELIETLSRESPGPSGQRWAGVPTVNISVKLTALYSQFEPAAPDAVSRAVQQRLVPLLKLARERNAFVNVDMEQYVYKDAVHCAVEDTLTLPELGDFTGAGVVVQAYLKDAPDDIERLKRLAQRRGAPITVRLVKGAYWEEERIVADQHDWPAPVYEDKAATDASFERCTDLLLDASPHLRAAFGTHNPRSVAQAAVKSRERGLERDVEFQMLFGMADTLRDAVVAEGFRTRVYVPVGAIIPGMAYLVRRLLENTSNQSWFVREALHATAEEILARPTPPPAPSPSTERGRTTSAPEGRWSIPSPSTERGQGEGFRNEAPAEFHRPEVREAMRRALAAGRRFPRQEPLRIGGRRVTDRETAEVRSPSEPALVVGRVAQATAADVEAAVAAAREAFPAWRDRAPEERGDILRRAADLLVERRFELNALMVHECAKPWREADGDVIEAADYLRFYALHAERLLQPVPMLPVMGEDNVLVREARGVTAVIAPWNFPLAIIAGMTAGALATGNCAILKPAEQSPLIAARLVDLLREAGVPDGAVQYLPGAGEVVGRGLVEHPEVETIAFTGSKEVGLGIVEAAGKTKPGQRNVKRVIAEMGGKNAIIIDDDADLDQAVSGVVTSAFGYAGQKCSACSRLIVIGSAYDDVTKRLAAAVESLVVGPADDPATRVPPVISAEARTRILGYVEQGKASARLLAQGAVPDGDGYFVAPTVFTDVGRDDRLARDEIFGPVLSVFRASDMDEALALALDSDFALTGGLYSRNPRNIERARQAFRVGNLYINRGTTGAVVGRHPFGGLGLSGIGEKAGTPDYLLQFLRPRSISENTTRRGFAPDEHTR